MRLMRFLLDKNVVIYLQKGVLNESLPPAFYSISIITEMELLSYPIVAASALLYDAVLLSNENRGS